MGVGLSGFFGLEIQYEGVDAKALVGRWWAVIKNVSEMTVATAAKDLDSPHAV
jgi:hypothetical protein